MNVRYSYSVIIIFFSFILISCGDKRSNEPSPISLMKENIVRGEVNFIAHAGGGLFRNGNQYIYTNSKEAILESLLDGKRFIEIDLIKTSDNFIVGAHHWSHFKEIVGLGSDLDEVPMSLEQFKSAKIYQKYTPVTIEDINDIMEEHVSMILVTDKIRDISLFSQLVKYPKRVLMECFVIDECIEAINSGIGSVAMNVNISNENIQEYIDLLSQSGIEAVTSSARLIRDSAIARENSRLLVDNGILNIVYTSNEPDFIKSSSSKYASGFYTDFYSISEMNCILDEQECKTY